MTTNASKLKEKMAETLYYDTRKRKRYPTHIKQEVISFINNKTNNGQTTSEGCKEINITQSDYYRWRKQIVAMNLPVEEKKSKSTKEITCPLSVKKKMVANISIGKDNIRFNGTTLIVKGEIARIMFSTFMEEFKA